MSPTRRSSAMAPRSYLHQLAEPLTNHSAILTPRRPTTERGPHNILDSVPPIFNTFADSFADPVANSSADKSATNVTLESPNTRHSQATSTQNPTVKPNPTPAPTQNPVILSEAQLSRRARISSAQPQDPIATIGSATRSGDTARSARREEARKTTRTAEAPTTLSPAPATTKDAPPTRTQPVEIHIGTVEVQLPAPPPTAPRPVSRDLNSIHTAARPARPLSRGLSWTYGLVQG